MSKARKPVLHNGILRLDPNNPQGAAINLEGAGWADWQQWLARNLPFIYTSAAGHFTAQAELRRNHAYWYGYRRRAGKLHKVYLGRAQDLQPAHLEAANNTLAGLLPSPSHPFTPTSPPSAPGLGKAFAAGATRTPGRTTAADYTRYGAAHPDLCAQRLWQEYAAQRMAPRLPHPCGMGDVVRG